MYRKSIEEDKEKNSEVIEMDDLEKTGEPAARSQPFNDALQHILERERKTPWKKFATFAITYIGLITFVMLKGGSRGTSIIGIHCGSPLFFAVILSAIPFLGGITFIVGRRLLREHREKTDAGYNFLPHDVIYDNFTVLFYPMLAVGSGCLAGFLGIGAGMVIAPIMLEIGVAFLLTVLSYRFSNAIFSPLFFSPLFFSLKVMPEVAQASSSFTILFTSSSTSMQFIMLGKLDWKAAIWFWCIGFVLSIVGQHLLGYILRKYKKQYLVAFFLAAVITLSALCMFALNIHDIAKDGISGSFHRPCSSKISG